NIDSRISTTSKRNSVNVLHKSSNDNFRDIDELFREIYQLLLSINMIFLKISSNKDVTVDFNMLDIERQNVTNKIERIFKILPIEIALTNISSTASKQYRKLLDSKLKEEGNLLKISL
ncbi:MAG: hypothetical protein MHPSP_001569, partial [Paramarteilia canceri]